MAKELVELHLAGMLDDGLAIPDPAPIERHQHNPPLPGWNLGGGLGGTPTVEEKAEIPTEGTGKRHRA